MAASRFNAARCRCLNVSDSTHQRNSSTCSSGFNLAASALIFSTTLMDGKYHIVLSAFQSFLPPHLNRHFQAHRVESNETRGGVLVVGFGRVGFHRGPIQTVAGNLSHHAAP